MKKISLLTSFLVISLCYSAQQDFMFGLTPPYYVLDTNVKTLTVFPTNPQVTVNDLSAFISHKNYKLISEDRSNGVLEIKFKFEGVYDSQKKRDSVVYPEELVQISMMNMKTGTSQFLNVEYKAPFQINYYDGIVCDRNLPNTSGNSIKVKVFDGAAPFSVEENNQLASEEPYTYRTTKETDYVLIRPNLSKFWYSKKVVSVYAPFYAQGNIVTASTKDSCNGSGLLYMHPDVSVSQYYWFNSAGDTVRKLEKQAFDLCPGKYTVRLVHGGNGCYMDGSITIPEKFYIKESVKLCNGSSYTFPDNTKLQAVQKDTTYNSQLISVQNQDSIIETHLSVVPFKPLNPSLLNAPTVVQNGQSEILYEVQNQIDADRFVWVLPNGFYGVGDSNAITINIDQTAQSGEIKVAAENSCGISDYVSIFVNVSKVAGLNSESLNHVKVFPNPIQSKLVINAELESYPLVYELTNVSGQIVKQGVLSTDSELNTSNFQSGIYFIKLNNTKGEQRIKLIKE